MNARHRVTENCVEVLEAPQYEFLGRSVAAEKNPVKAPPFLPMGEGGLVDAKPLRTHVCAIDRQVLLTISVGFHLLGSLGSIVNAITDPFCVRCSTLWGVIHVVLFYLRSFGYLLGCTVAVVSAQWPAEHKSNLLHFTS